PLHGIDPAWVGVLALTALATTRVVTADTLRTVNWSFALLFGILASLSPVFAATRVDRWSADIVATTVSGLATTPARFVAAVTMLSFAVSLVLRSHAAARLPRGSRRCAGRRRMRAATSARQRRCP